MLLLTANKTSELNPYIAYKMSIMNTMTADRTQLDIKKTM